MRYVIDQYFQFKEITWSEIEAQLDGKEKCRIAELLVAQSYPVYD